MSEHEGGRPTTFLGESCFGLAAGALLIACVVTVLVALGTGRPSTQGQTTCLSNASQLAACYGEAVATKRFDPTLHGSAQILSWSGPTARGDERMFICPGDQDTSLPETPDEIRAYHPADSAALRAARGLGSYAVRDFEKFPIDPNSTETQPILCDRQGKSGWMNHHTGFIVVAFTDGSAQKLTNAELGLPDGEPIVVGPDSPCPLLRVFERP